MSKRRDDLDNSYEAAKKYYKILLAHPYVKSVYVRGSRALGEETQHSDWDFQVVPVKGKKLFLSDPRLVYGLHADVSIFKKKAKDAVKFSKVRKD